MPELVRYSFRLPNRAVTFGQLRAEDLGVDPNTLREFPLDDALGLPVVSFYAQLQAGIAVRPSIGQQSLKHFPISVDDLELQTPPIVDACNHHAIALAAMELVQLTRDTRDISAVDRLLVTHMQITLEREQARART